VFPLKDTVRSREVPLVNLALIGLNVVVFLYEASLPPWALQRFLFAYGLVPARLFAGDAGAVPTLITSQFLHGGWFHLISNMWALWIFGDNVEDRMGHLRYLVFYLVAGVVAGLAQAFVNPGATVPMVGASGALSGVLGAYLVLFPGARVITLVPLFFLPWFVEVPAVLYLALWFFSQVFNGLFSLAVPVTAYGGVAWWAHIGGFVAGVLLVPFFARARRRYAHWHPDEYWPW